MLNIMVEHSGDGLDATYGALAHPIRRQMVERLRDRDARVTELAAGFDVSLAAASRHIRVLESAGLLRRTVRGRDHHLSLDPTPLADAAQWIDTYRDFWERRLDALDRLLVRGDE
jgi:DNA-binding transcriptional ArsR family regulator